MKKLLFAVSAFYSIFLMSCNNNGNSGNDNNISTSRDIIKGIETGDSTKLSSIAPDAVDHAGPTGDVTDYFVEAQFLNGRLERGLVHEAGFGRHILGIALRVPGR